MIELITGFLCLIQLLSIIQRKGIIIDFNLLQDSLKADLGELSTEKEIDVDLKSVLKKMLYVSLFFNFFYLSYYYLLFLKDLITIPVTIIAVVTTILSIIFEIILYIKIHRDIVFSKIKNVSLSSIATINSILQIAILISIIINIFS